MNELIEIVFDTETTGLEPEKGHKVIEIGAIKLKNRSEVVDKFHAYINPKRDVPEASFKIHGISEEFLKDKPIFREIIKDFQSFIGNFPLVAHNAAFDIKFLNYEFASLGHNEIEKGRMVDTLRIARKKFPGSPASLDALCKRYGIDLEERQRQGHGALLDAQLLVNVYRNLMMKDNMINFQDVSKQSIDVQKVEFPRRNYKLSEEEESAHQVLIKKIKTN